MTLISEVISAAIPGASDDDVQFIMWNRTPYPCGKVTARSIYRAASGWRRASENGVRLCDHCDNKAEDGHWECASCGQALRAALPLNAEGGDK